MKQRTFKNIFFTIITCWLLSACQEKKKEKESTKNPNIVFIYMDDLGYGDLSSYGAKDLQTPNIDKLATGGVRFTDGHATSATCTPSRYGLLTGEYPWRNKNANILSGTAPLIIGSNQLTIPKMLKEKGYHTGIVGKWHLGLGGAKIVKRLEVFWPVTGKTQRFHNVPVDQKIVVTEGDPEWKNRARAGLLVAESDLASWLELRLD